jgi:hypothetical protein
MKGASANWIQRIETVKRRVDVAEFMAMAKSLIHPQ